MRILFIGKRFYTNRDAYTERFGRIYQLPYWWAKAGHEVDLWLVDYHGGEAGVSQDEALTVETTPVLRWRFFKRWISACFSRRSARRPDIIVASGDCYIGLVAYLAACFCGSKFVFDVYDRYDVFDGYRRLPGFDPLTFLLRRSWIAMFASTKVLDELRPMTDRVLLVPNGLDLDRFRPMSMPESRRQFELPEDVSLVGYFGSMEPERGIEDLLAAVAMLVDGGTGVNLVIGGKADPKINFNYPWLHYLGNIEFSKMPAALASCDVLALPYRLGALMDNGASCKIAEYIAVQRPVVATRSPNLTRNFPGQAEQLDGLLATPGDAKDLARCISEQLSTRRLVDMPNGLSWREISLNTLAVLEKPGVTEDGE